MTDYESKALNVYASTYLLATDKMKLKGMITFTKSEAALDEVVMPDSTTIAHITDDDLIDNQDYNFTNMFSYSDLDYALMKLELGMTYKLSPVLTFTADGMYADLTDDQQYVYGDLTGSYYMIRTGFKYTF